MKFNRLFFIIGFVFYATFLPAKIDIVKMIEGMGETFGVPPQGYVYNYEVWNDSHKTIYTEQEGIASFMGGFFQSGKGYFGRKKIPSLFEAEGVVSKAVYHKVPYYFNFYISDDSPAHKSPIYKQFMTQLPIKKNDPNIYYFHVYTSRDFDKGRFDHDPQVELVGYQNPNEKDSEKRGSVSIGSQLSMLNFYNSTGVNVQVSLTYGTVPYTFTIEKHSHNSLGLPTKEPKKSSSIKDSAGTVKSIGSVSSDIAGNVVQKDESEGEKGEVVIQLAGVGSVANGLKTTSVDADKKRLDATNVSKKSTDEEVEKPLFSLRPNTITFSAYNATSQKYEQFQTLKLVAEGFEGKIYTIEIFKKSDGTLGIGIQGLMPGNYDLATTPRSRDLTPCPCTFWYQALDQTKLSAGDGYIDLPGQVWVVYAGSDSQVRSKVVPGQVVSWNLTRPLLNQGDEFVYFVYVATDDDAVAGEFVDKVAKGLIGKNVTNEYKKALKDPFIIKKDDKAGLDITGKVGKVNPILTDDEKVATMMGNLAISQGVIEDADSNVIGYILGTDVFMPKGVGFGRFYYTLTPSLTSYTNIVALLNSYLDTTKAKLLGADVQAALTKTVIDWTKGYSKNAQAAAKRVEQFLLQYGNEKVTVNQKLTSYGKGCLNSIVSGKISLKYPSLKLSTVTNQYVYDFGKGSIENMPKKVDILPINQKAMPVKEKDNKSLKK